MVPRPAARPGPAPPARPAWPAASATWARLCWRDFSAAAMALVSRPVSSLAALARPASEPSLPDVSAAAASACWSAGGHLGQHLPGLLLVLQRRRELPLGPLAPLLGVADLRSRLARRCPQAEQALLAGRAAARPVRAEHVTVSRHHPQPRVGAQDPDAVGEVLDHDDIAEQVRDRAAKLRRCINKIQSMGNVADSGLRRELARSAGPPERRRDLRLAVAASAAITSPARPASWSRSAVRMSTAESRPATTTSRPPRRARPRSPPGRRPARSAAAPAARARR